MSRGIRDHCAGHRRRPKEGDLDTVLDRLEADPGSADRAWERAILDGGQALRDRDAIRGIFLAPADVASVDLKLERPDADAVVDFMVEQHAFSKQRVEGALERFGAARGKAAQQSLFDF